MLKLSLLNRQIQITTICMDKGSSPINPNNEHHAFMLVLLWITVPCFRNHKGISVTYFKSYKYIAKRYKYVEIVIVQFSYSN